MRKPTSVVCDKPWEGLLVHADGSVRFCCFMLGTIGDLNQNTFTEIWNGPKAQEMRRAFLNDSEPTECRMCPLIHDYGEAKTKMNERV